MRPKFKDSPGNHGFKNKAVTFKSYCFSLHSQGTLLIFINFLLLEIFPPPTIKLTSPPGLPSVATPALGCGSHPRLSCSRTWPLYSTRVFRPSCWQAGQQVFFCIAVSSISSFFFLFSLQFSSVSSYVLFSRSIAPSMSIYKYHLIA